MPETELIDVYDDSARRRGQTPRWLAHRAGLWHSSFHCWIAVARGLQGSLLFQLRGPGQRARPNLLDVTAAGHLLAGEDEAAGVRELEEELGVDVPFERLVPLGVRCEVFKERFHYVNREFCHTFMLRDDRPLVDYRLETPAVAGLVEISIADGLRFFRGDTNAVAARGVLAHAPCTERRMEFTATHFAPRIDDRYYLKIFALAEKLIWGSDSRLLAI